MALIKVVQRNKEGEKTPTRTYSKKQENTVAKSLGGVRQKNSGATLFDKGDISVGDLFLVECKTKTHDANSITIKKEWFDKNLKETLITGHKYSTIAFNFGPGEENHYIIDENLFIELLEYLKEKEN